MAEKLRERFDAHAELVESSGGVFEVAVDGRLLYSKKETGRFPDEDELLRQIAGG
ncbi:MAG: SelT/SelW/SelH family protein [Desulfuromonadales bacterium]|nr:SelT/SelW/SelH family protein [Desulfuromonadales bacterium]NIR33733.1 SelT/SelW/SelH family protein [Desulfuromonadales bacterium]NIS39884.1 SelT/SelW/SelH family protein [Desulfuromonadales bacterium]